MMCCGGFMPPNGDRVLESIEIVVSLGDREGVQVLDIGLSKKAFYILIDYLPKSQYKNSYSLPINESVIMLNIGKDTVRLSRLGS